MFVMLLWRPSILRSPHVITSAHREGTGAFVRLSRGFVTRRLHIVSALVTSRSVLSGLPQSSMPIRTLQFSLLQESSTAVVQVCCGTVIWGLHVGHVLVHLFFTLRLPSIETLHLYISKPLSAIWGLNSTPTAIIVICVDSYIQALTAKHEMLTLIPITRSHAHTLTIYTSQVWSQPQQL